MVGNDPKKIRLSTELKNRIFVSKLMHEKSKTSILKTLKFVQQVPARSILGNEPFSLKYLYGYESAHIITKLQKDHFILPYLENNRGTFLDFFNFEIKDPTVPDAMRKIIEPDRAEMSKGEQKINLEKKISEIFLTGEEIDIKKTILHY